VANEWRSREEVGLPPKEGWVEVDGVFGMFNPTAWQGEARWFTKPNHEFFYWEIRESGEIHGSWYFFVEAWRPLQSEVNDVIQ